MRTMLRRGRCKMCTKWLPINHESYFCSSECEKQYNEESKFWASYKEKNRQEGIQHRKNNRSEHNKCLNCGDPISQTAKGRFRRYCGHDCKQEAYRKRRKRQEDEKENDNNIKPIITTGFVS